MSHLLPYRLRTVYVVAVVSVQLLMIALAQQKVEDPITNELGKNGAPKAKLEEELFKKAFVQRRKEHLKAVQMLLKVDSYERSYKMITIVMDKIMEILELNRNLVEKADFVPNNSSFPEDTDIKEALSSILENIALFGDTILHLPDITHRLLKVNQKWNSTIHWSLNFANQTQYLLDKSTLTMFHLVKQELNITEREHNYFNPYRITSVGKRENIVKNKKTVKRDKRKKSPQITKIEL